MQPVNFEQSNINLLAGNNPNTDDMPVAICENSELSNGQNIVYAVSVWQLSPEELAEVNRNGGKIFASQMGWPVPPLSLLAFDPFANYGYKPLIRVENRFGVGYVQEGSVYCLKCLIPKEKKELDQFGGLCIQCNLMQ